MSDLAKDISAFFISMVPLIELRGGIIYAAAQGIPFWRAFIICCLANILPVPVILLFLRKIFSFLERFKYTKKMVLALERRARAKAKSEKFIKYRAWGLFAFVAIPLPGTGAWTGSLIAVIMDMPIKKSFLAIASGVVGAGVIMSVLSFLIPGLFF